MESESFTSAIAVFVVVCLAVAIAPMYGAVALLSSLPERGARRRASIGHYLAIGVLLTIGLGIETCCGFFWFAASEPRPVAPAVAPPAPLPRVDRTPTALERPR